MVNHLSSRALLGVHVLGEDAAELINQGQAVLHHRGTIEHFIHSTYNIASPGEVNKYTAYDGLQLLAGRRAGAAAR